MRGVPLRHVNLVGSFWRRFLLATVIWALAWPIVYFFKLGDITGPKAWFWIIGELNYPIAAAAYVLIDSILSGIVRKSWLVFLLAVAIIAACMPFYYARYGFVLGVSLDARLF